MLQSKLNRLGGAKDDLFRSHLLPPLLNSMNAYVTTDEKSLSKSMSAAPFQVVTVVDPAIVPDGQIDAVTSLVCGHHDSNTRRFSSLSENILLQTPEIRRTSAGPLGKRNLSSSARRNRDELPSLTKRMQKLKELPALRAKLEKMKARLKEQSLDGDLPLTARIGEGTKALLEEELRNRGIILRKKRVSLDPIDMTSPVAARLMAESLAVKGGYAAKLAELKQKEKAIDHLVAPVKKKKKKEPKGPVKYKANLHSFKERIGIEGTDYVMEMYLAPDIIESTRKYHIDINKPPKIIPNSTLAADMRDEYSNYCGQRKALKNWLYYV